MLEHLIPRGYRPGGGLISPEGVFYLNIPKNASTYTTNLLLANGWNYYNLNEHPAPKQAVAILRDPIERWISGYATYAASYVLGYGYGSDHFCEDYNDLAERVIFDQLVFDDHTTEQIKFIEQLQDIPTTYFKLNIEMVMNMEKFFDVQLGLNTPVNANISEDNYNTKMIAKHMRWRIEQDPALKAKIITKYQADYDLIKTANYYNEPR
jgi:hypothetical protein